MTIFKGWLPQAVVFDCDGLLMDTEPCWTVAESTLFTRRGLTFTPEHKAAFIGTSLAYVGNTMATLFDEPGMGLQIADELLQLAIEVIGSQSQAMPYARELVELTRQRVPIGVASNSPRVLLETALASGGLTDCFDVSITADEVANPKPAPDLYFAACEQLEVAPTAALAFEDSMTGVRSARAAGLRVIGVPTLHNAEFEADLVVSALSDVDLGTWITGWEARQ